MIVISITNPKLNIVISLTFPDIFSNFEHQLINLTKFCNIVAEIFYNAVQNKSDVNCAI